MFIIMRGYCRRETNTVFYRKKGRGKTSPKVKLITSDIVEEESEKPPGRFSTKVSASISTSPSPWGREEDGGTGASITIVIVK